MIVEAQSSDEAITSTTHSVSSIRDVDQQQAAAALTQEWEQWKRDHERREHLWHQESMQLQSRIKKQEAELQEWNQRYCTLQNERDCAMRQCRQEYESAIASLEAERTSLLHDCATQLCEDQEQIETLKKELTDYTSLCKKYQSKCIDLEQELSKYQDMMNTQFAAMNAEYNRLFSAYDHLLSEQTHLQHPKQSVGEDDKTVPSFVVQPQLLLPHVQGCNMSSPHDLLLSLRTSAVAPSFIRLPSAQQQHQHQQSQRMDRAFKKHRATQHRTKDPKACPLDTPPSCPMSNMMMSLPSQNIMTPPPPDHHYWWLHLWQSFVHVCNRLQELENKVAQTSLQ